MFLWKTQQARRSVFNKTAIAVLGLYYSERNNGQYKQKRGVSVDKYVCKESFAIVTILIVCGITFFAMNTIPGGPFDGEKAVSPEVKSSSGKKYNLDKPIPEQFAIYMNNLLHGDFGISTRQAVILRL